MKILADQSLRRLNQRVQGAEAFRRLMKSRADQILRRLQEGAKVDRHQQRLLPCLSDCSAVDPLLLCKMYKQQWKSCLRQSSWAVASVYRQRSTGGQHNHQRELHSVSQSTMDTYGSAYLQRLG